jgi:cell division protein FtsQ
VRNVRREPSTVSTPPAATADSPHPPAAVRSVRPPSKSGGLSGQAAKPAGGPPSFPRIAKAFALLKVCVGIAIVIGASVGVAWGAKRYVTTSPRFAVKTVTVDGAQRILPQDVARAGGIVVGNNVFSLDLDEVQRKIEAEPWVASATVTRKLPGSVFVRVVEREAKALVLIEEKLYLVSHHGEIFKERGADDPIDLPLCTGIRSEDVVSDREGVEGRLLRALDVIEDLGKTSLGQRHPVQEVFLERDGSVRVIVGRDAVALHLGHPPFRPKLEQAERVFVELSKRKAQASIVFLDNDANPERVVVRMR